MRGYDNWKTRSPDDELDEAEPPETFIECAACHGEGGYEKTVSVHEHGCGFSHKDGQWTDCEVCEGVGGWIGEAKGN